jgi:hypothetical protein
MDDDDDLFNHAKRKAEAEAAKKAAMEQSEGGASPEWLALMAELVITAARLYRTFTSDEVFDLYDERDGAPTTHDSRAFGPVMRSAAKAGVCRKTNIVTNSRRASNHKRPIAIWESLIYAGA